MHHSVGIYGQIGPQENITPEQRLEFRAWLVETLCYTVEYNRRYKSIEDSDIEARFLFWLRDNCKHMWTFRFHSLEHMVFLFENRNDALMFKLKCDVPNHRL